MGTTSWEEKQEKVKQSDSSNYHPLLFSSPVSLDPQSPLAGFDQSFNLFQENVGGDRESCGLGEGDLSNNTRHEYPLRPYAEDCKFYVKNGWCKFGKKCRWNHPVRRENYQGAIGKDEERGDTVENSRQIECKYYLSAQGCKYGKFCRYSHSEGNSHTTPLELNGHSFLAQLDVEEKKEREEFKGENWQIECKFYRTAGGCKYGNSCKYNHPEEKIETGQPELNFLDLPIRPLERECPFYMRTGSCGYGLNCRFHHPEPVAVEESNTVNSASNEVTASRSLAGATCSSHLTTDNNNNTDQNLGDKSSSSSVTHLLPKEMQLQSDGNQYHVSAHPREKTEEPLSLNIWLKTNDVKNYLEQKWRDGFPERPGLPECFYFMRTGNCKFRSACKYHHPRDRHSKTPLYSLSNKYLPLESGKNICSHCEQNGACKCSSDCSDDRRGDNLPSCYEVDSAKDPHHPTTKQL